MTVEPIDVVIEIPAWTFRKMRMQSGQWRQEFLSPFPCPFNYGFTPQQTSEDGDAADVIVLAPRLRPAQRVRVRPSYCVQFLDDGKRDDKLVARLDGQPLVWHQVLLVKIFFWLYTWFKRARQGRAATRVLGYVSLP